MQFMNLLLSGITKISPCRYQLLEDNYSPKLWLKVLLKGKMAINYSYEKKKETSRASYILIPGCGSFL